MTVTCSHGWPRDGWPCPFRKCIDTARDAYLQAALEEAEQAARTPEDNLTDVLRAVWAQRPEQRALINALVEYVQAQQVTA